MYTFYSLRYCEGIRSIRHYYIAGLISLKAWSIASGKVASPYVYTVRDAERPISLEIVSGGNSKSNKWRQCEAVRFSNHYEDDPRVWVRINLNK